MCKCACCVLVPMHISGQSCSYISHAPTNAWKTEGKTHRGPGASPVAREVKYMRGPGADIPIENMHQSCLNQIKCASPERAVPWVPLKNVFVRENTCVANAMKE